MTEIPPAERAYQTALARGLALTREDVAAILMAYALPAPAAAVRTQITPVLRCHPDGLDETVLAAVVDLPPGTDLHRELRRMEESGLICGGFTTQAPWFLNEDRS
jgi:hypothetical protein